MREKKHDYEQSTYRPNSSLSYKVFLTEIAFGLFMRQLINIISMVFIIMFIAVYFCLLFDLF